MIRYLTLMFLAVVLLCGCVGDSIRADPDRTVTCPLCGETAKIRAVGAYNNVTYRCDQWHFHSRLDTGELLVAE